MQLNDLTQGFQICKQIWNQTVESASKNCKGTIHLRHWQFFFVCGEGSKIGHNFRWIVVKNSRREENRGQKSWKFADVIDGLSQRHFWRDKQTLASRDWHFILTFYFFLTAKISFADQLSLWNAQYAIIKYFNFSIFPTLTNYEDNLIWSIHNQFKPNAPLSTTFIFWQFIFLVAKLMQTKKSLW